MTRNRQNIDLQPNDQMHLPKVKSTINSHPKWVNKSRLMLGVNKFIGGTYRNTTLAQQQLNQSRSSTGLIGLQRSATEVPNYDASNYAAGTSQYLRPSLFEASNQPITSSRTSIVDQQSGQTVAKSIPQLPKWHRNYVPPGHNPLLIPAEQQQATLPPQLAAKDKQ